MKRPKLNWITLVFILGTIMMLGACKKKARTPAAAAPAGSVAYGFDFGQPGLH